ncbi:hypothetical protein PGT21_013549 [Puccinia graminis f. sp. tritici]|uniref:Uncharacterized protein n=1 Tax=Puccinia graminis f. sp. tritici TaxID=56615 RepID=A0A5B0PXH1_PUCGR|nr:hypothetical protein PGT21_013549 [Puccinia graminis f. sp. tritici]KAA1125160.1 hypothetical protein PGTUg99_006192 [Puccinia graminis f. sp. tritici]
MRESEIKMKIIKTRTVGARRKLLSRQAVASLIHCYSTQRVELGATASYTVTSPRPRYELDDPGAMFPAMTLGRINHTPLGLSTPTRGRNRPTASGGPEGGGATEGSQGCLLEGVMVCGAGWGWHNVVFRAPSARVRVVYRRTSGTLICCGLSLGPPVLGEP